ncbi:MAG: hypothetical protein L3J34_05810 [Flavobacteriaceae bacterium]|nr:hypothetical protein [Flavobacteriaceae bacterium]
MDQIEIKGKLKTFQINQALGFFILFFGVVVSIALIFPESDIQRMTNLVAGLTLVVIGGGMMLFARKNIKKLQKLIK